MGMLMLNLLFGWMLKKLLDAVWATVRRQFLLLIGSWPYAVVRRSDLSELLLKAENLRLLSKAADEFEAARPVVEPVAGLLEEGEPEWPN